MHNDQVYSWIFSNRYSTYKESIARTMWKAWPNLRQLFTLPISCRLVSILCSAATTIVGSTSTNGARVMPVDSQSQLVRVCVIFVVVSQWGLSLVNVKRFGTSPWQTLNFLWSWTWKRIVFKYGSILNEYKNTICFMGVFLSIFCSKEVYLDVFVNL